MSNQMNKYIWSFFPSKKSSFTIIISLSPFFLSSTDKHYSLPLLLSPITLPPYSFLSLSLSFNHFSRWVWIINLGSFHTQQSNFDFWNGIIKWLNNYDKKCNQEQSMKWEVAVTDYLNWLTNNLIEDQDFKRSLISFPNRNPAAFIPPLIQHVVRLLLVIKSWYVPLNYNV